LLTLGCDAAKVLAVWDAVTVVVELRIVATGEVNLGTVGRSWALVKEIVHKVTVGVLLRRGTAHCIGGLAHRGPVADIVGVVDTVTVGVPLVGSTANTVDDAACGGCGALVNVVRDGVTVGVQLIQGTPRGVNGAAQRRAGASVEGVHHTVVIGVLLAS